MTAVPGVPDRLARLALVDREGEPLGVLPPYPVATPWWQDAGPIVAGAREAYGVDIVVLRLLETELPRPNGGLVTYLAELDGPLPAAAEPWQGDLSDHPLRQPWARPGGPDADLAWADERIRAAGLRRVGRAEQVRTWNLSSLWRLPVADGVVWLKHVPPFFAHEGRLLAELAGRPVPALVAHEGGRILMPELRGDDLYDAREPLLARMVRLLVGLQREWTGRIEELLRLGLPDWRGPALAPRIADTLARTAPELTSDDRRALTRFVDGLPERFARIEDAGLPATLVHGDFHPGNLRGGEDGPLVLLDWGDSGVGHPLLDQAAFLDRIPQDAVEPIRRLWREAWCAAVPGADPDRAAALLRPVAAARQAVIYRGFLDRIEPSEHPYHAADPAEWLGRVAAIVSEER